MRSNPHSKGADDTAPKRDPKPREPQVAAIVEPYAVVQANRSDPLGFEDEDGSYWPQWLALIICLGLIGWMLSGVFLADAATDPDLAPAPTTSPVTVGVTQSNAEPVMQFFKGEGQAAPERETAIRAEMAGRVQQLFVKKGDSVRQGQRLAQLDPTQRAAELNRAQEGLSRALREFEIADSLLKRGTSTTSRVAKARAGVATAKAELSTAQQGLGQTELVSPFGGRIETLAIAEGVYVQEGAEIARIVDTDPLTVTVRVPQQTYGLLQLGASATVAFITGQQREGVVTFLGGRADAATRTFLAEISVPNTSAEIPAGISAQVQVPIGEVTAHFLSPAILSLGEAGVLGVKTVDPQNRVVFTPVEIAKTQSDGIWVTGLASHARLITVGQGFVTAGEAVIPKEISVSTDAPT